MLSATAAVASDLQLSQRIAGHRSQLHTQRYTKLTLLSDNLKVTSRLVVPGLHCRFGSYDQSQVLSYLEELNVSNVNYVPFKTNWLDSLLSRLYTTRYQSQFTKDQDVDYSQATIAI